MIDACSIAHSVFPIPRPSVLMHNGRDINLAFLYLEKNGEGKAEDEPFPNASL